jgi:hypothetical protein
MPSNQPGEYQTVSWTEIFCQCLPIRNPKPTTEPDIEMQNMSSPPWPPRSTSLRRATNLNNPVIPDSIVRANDPDNITRPSHNSWWLRDDDDDRSVPSAPPSRSGARNPIASHLSDTPGPSGMCAPPRTKNPYTVTWLDTAPRPSSSVYMSGGIPTSSSSSTYSSDPSWNLPAPESILSSASPDQSPAPSSGNDIRVPNTSPRAASYAAVLDVICPWCSSFCYVLVRLSQLLSIVGIFLFLCHILIHLHTFLPQFRSSDTEHAYPFLAYKLSASMRMYRHELARTIVRECRLDFFMQVATFGSQLCIPRLEVRTVPTKSSPVLRRDYAINPCLG